MKEYYSLVIVNKFLLYISGSKIRDVKDIHLWIF